MRKLKKKKHRFVSSTVATDTAIDMMDKSDQPFKVDLLTLLKTKGSTAITKAVDDDKAASLSTDSSGASTVTLYQAGDFIDLCRDLMLRTLAKLAISSYKNLLAHTGVAKKPTATKVYGLCEKSLNEQAGRLSN